MDKKMTALDKLLANKEKIIANKGKNRTSAPIPYRNNVMKGQLLKLEFLDLLQFHIGIM